MNVEDEYEFFVLSSSLLLLRDPMSDRGCDRERDRDFNDECDRDRDSERIEADRFDSHKIREFDNDLDLDLDLELERDPARAPSDDDMVHKSRVLVSYI